MSNAKEKEFSVGDRVRVVSLPPYVKTADPMPMLRPPNVIHLGEEGVVMDRRPGGYWGVRFSTGTFLIDSQHIELVSTISTSQQDAGQNPYSHLSIPPDDDEPAL
jgi:hypothetical protein